jgi:hypothetical protein
MKILKKEITGTQSLLFKGYVPSKVSCTCYYIVYMSLLLVEMLLQATQELGKTKFEFEVWTNFVIIFLTIPFMTTCSNSTMKLNLVDDQ